MTTIAFAFRHQKQYWGQSQRHRGDCLQRRGREMEHQGFSGQSGYFSCTVKSAYKELIGAMKIFSL